MKSPTKPVRQALTWAIALAVSASALAEEPAPLPDAGKKLQQAYRQQVEAVAKPVRERYLADLKRLQEQATKAGKPNDALALQQEIEALVVGHLLGEWDSSGGRLHIGADHTATFSNGNTATWEVQGGDLVLKWKNPGVTYKISISQTGETFHGREIGADGRSTAISGTRLP